MTMLITLAQAKAHLRVTHDAEDTDIEEAVLAASGAIINYLKPEVVEAFVDTSGDVIMTTDSPSVSLVPPVVQSATKIMVGYFFNYREGDDKGIMTPGYLPAPVVALLYPLRDPTLA